MYRGKKSRGGLLSEMDRERLAEQEVELAPTSRQETCIQKFYMYLNLTKPSQQLILSWSLADADGKSLRPSWLIASIKELFPKVDIRTEADRTLTGLLALPEGSLTELTEAVQAAREQKETRLQQALIRWYAEHTEWQQKLDRLLDAVFFVKPEQPIGQCGGKSAVRNASGRKRHPAGTVCSLRLCAFSTVWSPAQREGTERPAGSRYGKCIS